ncbi:hypothetical protein BH24DEI2_BH24DEI2_17260 [soil metagenome]
MTQDEWRQTLDNLRAEAATLDPDDVQGQERLERHIGAVEHHLDNPDDAEHRATVLDDLSGSATHFEAEHPRLTLALNQLMMQLSSMGI